MAMRSEGHADILGGGGGDRLGLPYGTLGVHVDEAHLHGGEGVVQLAVTRK